MTDDRRIAGILDSTWAIPNYSRNETIALLAGDGAEIRRLAHRRTLDAFGDRLIRRASCEITNYCRKSCSFCGLARDNDELSRYRMTVDEVREAIAGVLARQSVDYLHLTGGEDPAFKSAWIVEIIGFAREHGLPTTLVLGQRKQADYDAFKAAGADAYILKLETTSPALFSKMRLDGSLAGRVGELLHLRDMGWKIGTGVIAGLPEQTVEDLADDLNVIYKIAPDHASVSRFSSNESAILGHHPDGDVDVTLNFLALLRLVLAPGVTVPGGTSLCDDQFKAFQCGANVASVHITKPDYIHLYSTYRHSGRIVSDTTRVDELQAIARS